ncbi:MAG: cdd [Haloplasmataceae bacterium]|nr:cdd [Haloplasmataceae bacterium]
MNNVIDVNRLVEKAIVARSNAYTPYSKFNVGCAVLLKNGEIVMGSNIENASFGLTNCAERSALFSAFSQGYRGDDIVALAVVGDTEQFISPCGACRQVIIELVNDNTQIILSNLKGDIKILDKHALLPFSFTSKDLE